MKSDSHGPTALYRAFSADGVLLYVGVAVNPFDRTSTHERQKEWWPEVRNITVEFHSTGLLAMEAETVAITNENPKYNISRMSIGVGKYAGRGWHIRDGYVFRINETSRAVEYEHNLLMIEKLGQPIPEGYLVWHRNGVRNDNRPDNLQLRSLSPIIRSSLASDQLSDATDIFCRIGHLMFGGLYSMENGRRGGWVEEDTEVRGCGTLARLMNSPFGARLAEAIRRIDQHDIETASASAPLPSSFH